MSNRYKGAIISATPPTTTGGESGVASGAWTLEQQMQLQAAGLWPSQPLPKYIEDVFSTYLYMGNGATNQTITNGIDLSTKGGLVWIKNRPTTPSHFLSDSGSNFASYMSSNATTANTSCSSFFAATTSGFTLTGAGGGLTNNTGDGYVSWTFRKQPKFFDIVTYTGNGTNPRNISHNLGSAPGCIIVKSTSAVGNWSVYHRGVSPINNNTLSLQSTAAASDGGQDLWGNGATVVVPTSTVFTVSNSLNTNGVTYIAYLFAHDAGGFGPNFTDNVISCGSYTGNGSTQQDITLGYEPQWLMIKRTDTVDSWIMVDNMRGFFQTADNALCANNANAEAATVSVSGAMQPIATGFHLYNANSSVNASGGTYIYIAIRRGPMKVPTDATKVFAPAFVQAAANNATRVQTGFPVDMTFMNIAGSTAAVEIYEYDRLRNKAFQTYSNAVEQSNPFGSEVSFASNTGFVNVSGSSLPAPSFNVIFLNFQRAPSFFDVVCYTGTGSATTVTHNLAAVPELMLVKSRTQSVDWIGWTSYATPQQNQYQISLNTAGAWSSSGDKVWGATTTGAPSMTSTTFSLGDYIGVNNSGSTYVAYLFATCAGVSKVGSYTGTGALQTVACGFTSGARFVLIKRTDSTGAWYVWDSARGISSGDDPYLLLNSTAAQVNNTNYVDTDTTGFKVTAAAPAGINASGGTYIFLAVA